MKKEDFIKLGLDEETAKKCEAASTAELEAFVPKAQFDELIGEKDNQLRLPALYFGYKKENYRFLQFSYSLDIWRACHFLASLSFRLSVPSACGRH